MNYPERATPSNWIAGFVPEWMRQESAYAFTKFDGENNPQRTALTGGLHGDGRAAVEIANYFGNFKTFSESAAAEPHILTLASRQLGKFVNAIRVTNVFLVKEASGMSFEHADEAVMDQLERICRLIDRVDDFESIDLAEYYASGVAGPMEKLAKLIDQRPEAALYAASDFLKKQVELFVGFSQYAGVIAQPGDKVGPWVND
jgi:hypothetical protein